MKNPFSFFDKIYCISVDEKSLRWKKSKKQLELLGIYERTERIQAEITEKYYDGCRRAHKLCIRKAKEAGAKNLLILEDDFIFISRDMNHLNSTLENLKKYDWELFYLGGKIDKKIEDLENNLCSVKLWFTHAYAINHTVFDKILSYTPKTGEFHLTPKHKSTTTDEHIDTYYYINDFKQYLINPVMAFQTDEVTTDRAHFLLRSFWNKIL